MQKIKFRYLQHLLRHKTSLIIAFLIWGVTAKAQLRDSWNLENHDDKPYYFGIVLGYNSSHYNITHHTYFLENDTVLTVYSENSGRIHLCILVNWQASKRFDIRFYPLNARANRSLRDSLPILLSSALPVLARTETARRLGTSFRCSRTRPLDPRSATQRRRPADAD